MAAPDELFCWEGAWGLPSVSSDCLTVLAYAQFAGAPLKLRKISNPWRSPSGSLPALRTNQKETLSRPSDIIIHLRKQFNADYDLSAREGADSLAFISLLEERLKPALIYNSWVDSKNYVEVTRRWYAEHLPFPLNFLLPGRMQRQQLETLRLLRGEESLEGGEELEKEVRRGGGGGDPEAAERRGEPGGRGGAGEGGEESLEGGEELEKEVRGGEEVETLRLLRGEESLEGGEELEKEVRGVGAGEGGEERGGEERGGEERGEVVEKELYREASDCMNLLSQRLGARKFFFGDSPSSLDAYVFAYLAPLLKAKLPNGKLQQHLKSLENLSSFCSNILLLYFPQDARESSGGQKSSSPPQPEGGDYDHVPNKRRKQLMSVLVALGAMLSYAVLTGILSIQHLQQEALEAPPPDRQTLDPRDEDEEGDG
ncbi:hypothetical protein NQZ68_031989 [Dissostichus eleginoides]|nr:hypothetical protein NQZ68_031989 [Dissostichus eleginoides]